MDLSTLSKETLIKIIEDQQKTIDQLKKPKQIKIDTSMYEIYNEDTQEKEQLDKETIFMYGSGAIRYKQNGKYYHGCGPMETMNSWYKEEFARRIFEYVDNKKLPNKEIDTYNASKFCMNCENIQTRKSTKIIRYKCKGHPIG